MEDAPDQRDAGGDAGEELSLDELLEGKTDKQAVKVLRKHCKALKMEVVELEDRLADQEEELKDAGDAIAQVTRNAAAREGDMQDEVTQLKRAKEADKQAMVASLQEKESVLSALQQKFDALDQTHRTTQERLVEAQAEQERGQAERDTLREELAHARSRVDQSAEALRAELRQVEAQAAEASAAHNQWRHEAQRRQAALETSNFDLSQTLAEVQRKLDASEKAPAANLVDESQLASALDELDQARAQLELERQHHYTAQLTVRNLQADLAAVKAAAEDDRRRLSREVAEAQAEAEEATKKLATQERQREAEGARSGIADEFEHRLTTMSDQLLKKQVCVPCLSLAFHILTPPTPARPLYWVTHYVSSHTSVCFDHRSS